MSTKKNYIEIKKFKADFKKFKDELKKLETSEAKYLDKKTLYVNDILDIIKEKVNIVVNNAQDAHKHIRKNYMLHLTLEDQVSQFTFGGNAEQTFLEFEHTIVPYLNLLSLNDEKKLKIKKFYINNINNIKTFPKLFEYFDNYNFLIDLKDKKFLENTEVNKIKKPHLFVFNRYWKHLNTEKEVFILTPIKNHAISIVIKKNNDSYEVNIFNTSIGSEFGKQKFNEDSLSGRLGVETQGIMTFNLTEDDHGDNLNEVIRRFIYVIANYSHFWKGKLFKTDSNFLYNTIIPLLLIKSNNNGKFEFIRNLQENERNLSSYTDIEQKSWKYLPVQSVMNCYLRANLLPLIWKIGDLEEQNPLQIFNDWYKKITLLKIYEVFYIINKFKLDKQSDINIFSEMLISYNHKKINLRENKEKFFNTFFKKCDSIIEQNHKIFMNALTGKTVSNYDVKENLNNESKEIFYLSNIDVKVQEKKSDNLELRGNPVENLNKLKNYCFKIKKELIYDENIKFFNKLNNNTDIIYWFSVIINIENSIDNIYRNFMDKSFDIKNKEILIKNLWIVADIYRTLRFLLPVFNPNLDQSALYFVALLQIAGKLNYSEIEDKESKGDFPYHLSSLYERLSNTVYFNNSQKELFDKIKKNKNLSDKLIILSIEERELNLDIDKVLVNNCFKFQVSKKLNELINSAIKKFPNTKMIVPQDIVNLDNINTKYEIFLILTCNTPFCPVLNNIKLFDYDGVKDLGEKFNFEHILLFIQEPSNSFIRIKNHFNINYYMYRKTFHLVGKDKIFFQNPKLQEVSKLINSYKTPLPSDIKKINEIQKLMDINELDKKYDINPFTFINLLNSYGSINDNYNTITPFTSIDYKDQLNKNKTKLEKFLETNFSDLSDNKISIIKFLKNEKLNLDININALDYDENNQSYMSKKKKIKIYSVSSDSFKKLRLERNYNYKETKKYLIKNNAVGKINTRSPIFDKDGSGRILDFENESNPKADSIISGCKLIFQEQICWHKYFDFFNLYRIGYLDSGQKNLYDFLNGNNTIEKIKVNQRYQKLVDFDGEFTTKLTKTRKELKLNLNEISSDFTEGKDFIRDIFNKKAKCYTKEFNNFDNILINNKHYNLRSFIGQVEQTNEIFNYISGIQTIIFEKKNGNRYFVEIFKYNRHFRKMERMSNYDFVLYNLTDNFSDFEYKSYEYYSLNKFISSNLLDRFFIVKKNSNGYNVDIDNTCYFRKDITGSFQLNIVEEAGFDKFSNYLKVVNDGNVKYKIYDGVEGLKSGTNKNLLNLLVRLLSCADIEKVIIIENLDEKNYQVYLDNYTSDDKGVKKIKFLVKDKIHLIYDSKKYELMLNISESDYVSARFFRYVYDTDNCFLIKNGNNYGLISFPNLRIRKELEDYIINPLEYNLFAGWIYKFKSNKGLKEYMTEDINWVDFNNFSKNYDDFYQIPIFNLHYSSIVVNNLNTNMLPHLLKTIINYLIQDKIDVARQLLDNFANYINTMSLHEKYFYLLKHEDFRDSIKNLLSIKFNYSYQLTDKIKIISLWADDKIKTYDSPEKESKEVLIDKLINKLSKDNFPIEILSHINDILSIKFGCDNLLELDNKLIMYKKKILKWPKNISKFYTSFIIPFEKEREFFTAKEIDRNNFFKNSLENSFTDLNNNLFLLILNTLFSELGNKALDYLKYFCSDPTGNNFIILNIKKIENQNDEKIIKIQNDSQDIKIQKDSQNIKEQSIAEENRITFDRNEFVDIYRELWESIFTTEEQQEKKQQEKKQLEQEQQEQEQLEKKQLEQEQQELEQLEQLDQEQQELEQLKLDQKKYYFKYISDYNQYKSSTKVTTKQKYTFNQEQFNKLSINLQYYIYYGCSLGDKFCYKDNSIYYHIKNVTNLGKLIIAMVMLTNIVEEDKSGNKSHPKKIFSRKDSFYKCILIYEFMNGFFLRKQQLDLIYNIIENYDKNQPRIYQLAMGRGKTSVLGPLISTIYYLKTNKNILNIMPKNLVGDATSKYRKYLIPFIKLDVKPLSNYSKCKNPLKKELFSNGCKGIYIMSDETVKIIHLNSETDLIFSEECKVSKVSEMIDKEFWQNFRDKSVTLIDEIDGLSNPQKSELNYPLKGVIPCELRYRLELIMNIIDKLCEPKLLKNVELSDLKFDQYWKFKINYNKSDAVKLVNAMSLVELNGVDTSTLIESGEIRSNGWDYRVRVKKKNKIKNVSSDKLIKELGNNKKYILKHIFHDLLPTFLTTIYQVNFGLKDDKNLEKFKLDEPEFDFLAVPYEYADKPSEKSKFTDIDLTILYTYLSLKIDKRLRNIDVSKITHDYKKKHIMMCRILQTTKTKSLAEFKNIFNLKDDFSFNKVNLMIKDTNQYEIIKQYINNPNSEKINKIYMEKRKNLVNEKKIIFNYLKNLIIERNKPSEENYNLSFIDILMSTFTKLRVGFTGTPSNRIPIEKNNRLSFQINDNKYYVPDELALGKYYASSIGKFGKQNENSNKPQIFEINESDNVLNKIIEKLENRTCLIDVGALLKGNKPLSIVQAIKKKKKNLKELVFMDDAGKNKFINDATDTGKILIDDNVKNNKFVYFDNASFVGKDIKQKDSTRALLTVSHETNFRDFIQGLYRLRRLEQGQMYDIVILTTSKEKIMKDFNLKGNLSLENLIKYLLYNDVKEEKAGDFNFYIQNGRAIMNNEKNSTQKYKIKGFINNILPDENYKTSLGEKYLNRLSEYKKLIHNKQMLKQTIDTILEKTGTIRNNGEGQAQNQSLSQTLQLAIAMSLSQSFYSSDSGLKEIEFKGYYSNNKESSYTTFLNSKFHNYRSNILSSSYDIIPIISGDFLSVGQINFDTNKVLNTSKNLDGTDNNSGIEYISFKLLISGKKPVTFKNTLKLVKTMSSQKTNFTLIKAIMDRYNSNNGGPFENMIYKVLDEKYYNTEASYNQFKKITRNEFNRSKYDKINKQLEERFYPEWTKEYNYSMTLKEYLTDTTKVIKDKKSLLDEIIKEPINQLIKELNNFFNGYTLNTGDSINEGNLPIIIKKYFLNEEIDNLSFGKFKSSISINDNINTFVKKMENNDIATLKELFFSYFYDDKKINGINYKNEKKNSKVEHDFLPDNFWVNIERNKLFSKIFGTGNISKKYNYYDKYLKYKLKYLKLKKKLK